MAFFAYVMFKTTTVKCFAQTKLHLLSHTDKKIGPLLLLLSRNLLSYPRTFVRLATWVNSFTASSNSSKIYKKNYLNNNRKLIHFDIKL